MSNTLYVILYMFILYIYIIRIYIYSGHLVSFNLSIASRCSKYPQRQAAYQPSEAQQKDDSSGLVACLPGIFGI